MEREHPVGALARDRRIHQVCEALVRDECEPPCRAQCGVLAAHRADTLDGGRAWLCDTHARRGTLLPNDSAAVPPALFGYGG